ncbi:MAG: bacteriohemerythrin [Treponemataceae bacterium]|nr:MAG: bacteriohemerythrin [Treponemataceae bacterium]
MSATLVQWSEDFSVKNRLIDTQHKELVRFTNELYAACKTGGFSERLSFIRTVQDAVNYAKEHFSTEERMLIQKNYPEYAQHKTEHDAFVAEVLRQVKQLDNMKDIEGKPFVFFLRDWLLNHIAISDKKYTPYVQDD